MHQQPFNRDWQFLLTDAADDHWPRVDESSWRTVHLPHDWSIELPRDPGNRSGSHGGYFQNGVGLYRAAIDAPEAWRDGRVLVEFEGVYMNAEVWLGEHFLGRHPYGYTTFGFDLTPFLRCGERNLIRVKVDVSGMKNSRWYSGAGIYRPVWIVTAPPVHVVRWGVRIFTPEMADDHAVVSVGARVQNDTSEGRRVRVTWRVVEPLGTEVAQASSRETLGPGEARELKCALRIDRPRRWSLEDPFLYRLQTQVATNGLADDTESTPFGIRSLSFDAVNGFLLNGVALKLRGGCVHHDNGILGAASHARSEERKVELLKASGFNAVRCAHNPPAPAFLDACDRLGMLAIDEAFDCWREGKNPHDYHLAFDDWWQRDIDAMVLRDRNHPSVILWSIGNEVVEREGRSGAEATARMLAERVRTLDPTRGITAGICGSVEGRPWDPGKGILPALDVGGYNYLSKEYRSDHARFPRRVIIGTESLPKEAFENWSEVEECPFVAGDFVWTALDYLGEAGLGRVHFDGEKAPFLGEYPWHLANCGDIDLCGLKRPQSYYRDILWQRGAQLFIAVHAPVPEGKKPTVTSWGWPDIRDSWTWPGCEGSVFTLDVYSALPEVELFLNGRSVGREKSGKAEKHIANFRLPYQPGRLEAVGLVAGVPVARCALETCGAPAALRLVPHRPVIGTQDGEVCFVAVEVVDDRGLVDPNADSTVHFEVSGVGELAAVGSADPVSREAYRGDRRSVFRGRCLAALKPSGVPGEIRLLARADGLAPAQTGIRCTGGMLPISSVPA